MEFSETKDGALPVPATNASKTIDFDEHNRIRLARYFQNGSKIDPEFFKLMIFFNEYVFLVFRIFQQAEQSSMGYGTFKRSLSSVEKRTL